METSKILMRKAEIYPRLKLGLKQEKGGVKSTGRHLVRLLSDKVTLGRDRETSEIVEMVKYVMEVNGEKREYRTRMRNKDTKELNYLVQILSRVPEGTEVYLEMKKMGPRNYIEVTNLDGTRIAEDDDSGEDVGEDEGVEDEETVISLDGDEPQTV